MELPIYDKLCNCTYTGTGGQKVKMDIAVLFKLLGDMLETPQLFTMDIDLRTNNYLSKNTIIMSSDVAEALEEALKP